MVPKYDNLDIYGVDHLLALVDARTPENEILDFKQESYEGSERGKKEWCRDISAFANSRGGCIALGVSEERGQPDRIVGLRADVDEEEQRLVQLASNGIRPGLQVRTRRISHDGKAVLLLAVPASPLRPHMVTTHNDRRFYVRRGAQRVDMTYDDVRKAVLVSESSERVALTAHRAFRDTLPTAGGERPVAVLDLRPPPGAVETFDPANDGHLKLVQELRPTGGWSDTGRITFDGFAKESSHGQGALRALRDGTIQSWFRIGADLGNRQFAIDECADRIKLACRDYLSLYCALHGDFPAHACLSFKGRTDWQPVLQNTMAGAPIDLDLMEFPPLALSGVPLELTAWLRPWRDRIWQAAGEQRAPDEASDEQVWILHDPST